MGPELQACHLLQAPLAIISLICGVSVWLQESRLGWLVAAVLVGSVVPFTVAIIRPTNHQLLAQGRDPSSLETHELLVRWGRLHAVRAALSLVGTAIYLWLLLGPPA